MFPWTLLAKGIADLAAASETHLGGITWHARAAYCQTSSPSPALQAELNFWQTECVMPLTHIYWVLAIQCVAYMTLAVYMDNVLPDENGVKRPAWYFLQPGYWLPPKVSVMPAQLIF
jgi:hypothetical protein